MLVLVLPAIALTILVGTTICAWLIFAEREDAADEAPARAADVQKTRPTPTGRRPPAARKTIGRG